MKPSPKAYANKMGVNGSYLKLYPNSTYDPTEYERPCVTVDIATCRVFDGELQILLIKRNESPYKDMWAIPGGFVSIAGMEDISATATRKLQEETGLSNIPIYQLKAYGDAKRDPRWRIITVTYYALISPDCDLKTIKAGTDVGWYSVNDLPDLAFDHKTIISDLVSDLQRRIVIEPVGFSLVNTLFTWSQLQSAYEAVLQKSLLSPNFRRKLLSDYDIQMTDEKKSEGKGRPSTLMKFIGVKTLF